MKKNVKRLLSILCAAILTLGLTGCGQDFDATNYVKAELDLLTRHDVDQYVELMGIDKETAEEIYADIIADMEISSTILGDSDLPEELFAAYDEWFVSAMAKTKYTVMEATETDDAYTVNVEIEPLKAFDGLDEKVNTKTQEYMEEITQKVMNGEEMPSDAEINEAVYTFILDILNETLETATYAEKIVVETKIMKNSDGEYEIDTASFEEVGEKLFDISGLEL